MKIAYAFPRDAANPGVQSGRPASILRAFAAAQVEIVPAFPLAAPLTGTDFAKKIGYRLVGKMHRTDRDDDTLKALATAFHTRTAGQTFDLIFSPGSEAVAKLQTDVPIAFCADATFANLVDYYWDFTGLSEEYLQKGHAQEFSALSRTALAVYPSEWAANSAVQAYGADPEKVAVIEFGANLGSENERALIHAAIEQRPREPIRLLFSGRHWGRKGGELVVNTAFCLVAHGHRVTLDIIGCELPAAHRDVPWIKCHGLLNPGNPAEVAKLNELFVQAHFVFVPSQAEAYGLTFAEACAFGVPAISTATGGIPAIIRHGHNGILLPVGTKPSEFADAIIGAFRDPHDYRAMCHRAFHEFETRLNWRVFTQRFLAKAAERIEHQRRVRAREPIVASA